MKTDETELTEKQKRALDDMVERRCKNTGESRKEAAHNISLYLQSRILDKV